ncbi:Transcription factor COE2 [Dionaea muscipula]
MSQLFNGSGEENFFLWESVYSSPKEAGIFWSLGNHVDVYLPRKRARISAPLVLTRERFEQKKQISIDVLPDECLFEIFRRLSGDEERSVCACVSKRWLMLLSGIQRKELSSRKTISDDSVHDIPEAGDPFIDSDDGCLTRSLEGKKATDVRLASIAVGTGRHGRLRKLMIRGTNSAHGVTNVGLRAIARGCPSLRVLSLWNVSSIGDEGLIEIANGCQQLEKIDLCSCPSVTDKALIAIAKKCRNLADLTIESCPNIGNEGLQAVGQFCPNLKSLSIKDCALVGDQGIAGVLSSATFTLTKLKLQALNISDVSLAVVGHYGKAVTNLVLASLPDVTEKGFWVMGRADGLQKLKTLSITSCIGVTDRGLEEVGKGCPNLKVFCLHKSAFLSDGGLVSFAKAGLSLESLQLEECDRITQAGFFGVLLTCGSKLKALAMTNCFGIEDMPFGVSLPNSCTTLSSLSIRNCPGFGNINLGILAKMCPRLRFIDLSGLHGITDAGLLPLIGGCDAGLVKVNLSGSINVTDEVVMSLTKLHGGTLEVLNLDGCGKVTDASLVLIAEDCLLINELDVSKCAITDFGIASLARSKHINLQILSLSGCSMASDKSFPFLVKLGQNLMGLNLHNCNAISRNVVDMLTELLWRCDILS